MDIHDNLETKAGYAPEAGVTHAELMRTFEAFKAANDDRIEAIERKAGDILQDDKVARIDAALDAQARRLDELTLKSARPQLGLENATRVASREHKQAFESYMRSGDASALRGLESKAMSIGTPGDGGYLVPPEVEQEIGKRLAVISPIRSIASVREISGNVFKKPFMTAGPATGWVAETASRPQTSSPTLDELSFPAAELYAMPAATGALLEDAVVNLDEWIAGEVEQVFAVQEGAAFVNGDGTNKPKGFLQYDKVAEGSWAWTKIGFLETGVDAGFPEDGAADPLIDLVYALKAGYRQNASFVMNRKTQSAIRKLKDADDNYLWQPPAQVGGRAGLLTFPVVEAEEMPDIAADSYSIAFGDFARGYLVVDRQGVRVLRDPYSAKPYVLFYTTKRVGGGVQDFDAIKLLKFSGA